MNRFDRKLIKAKEDIERYILSKNSLINGFILGILASMISTIIYQDVLIDFPKRVRYGIDLIILLIFLIILGKTIRDYKKYLNSLKGLEYLEVFYKSIKKR